MRLQLETKVKCSKYRCRRSIPLMTFSNPFRIPERAKLKRSTGFTNFIKYKRTSAVSDDKFIVDVLILSPFSWNYAPKMSPSTKLLMLRIWRTPRDRLLWAADDFPDERVHFPRNNATLSLFPTFPPSSLLPLQTANCRLAQVESRAPGSVGCKM